MVELVPLMTDFFDSDHIDQNIPSQKTNFDIPSRKNLDFIVNSHGRKIIQFCQSTDFTILNGRAIGDIVGNLTFMKNNNGTSTIDYGLCNNAFYENIENFMIMPQTELSDHCKIVTFLKSKIAVPNQEADNYNWKKLKTRYKWDNRRKDQFCDNLAHSTVEIEDIKQRIDAGLIKSTGEKVQNIFTKAADHSLQCKKSPPDKNWKKTKKVKKVVR